MRLPADVSRSDFIYLFLISCFFCSLIFLCFFVYFDLFTIFDGRYAGTGVWTHRALGKRRAEAWYVKTMKNRRRPPEIPR